MTSRASKALDLSRPREVGDRLQHLREVLNHLVGHVLQSEIFSASHRDMLGVLASSELATCFLTLIQVKIEGNPAKSALLRP